MVRLAPLPGLPTRGAPPPALPYDSVVKFEINYYTDEADRGLERRSRRTAAEQNDQSWKIIIFG